MTRTMYLDPEKVSQLEPSEGDERSMAMLSPAAVPQSVSMEVRSKEAIYVIQFHYSGGETAGGQERLDDRSDPAVMIRTSTLTHKILELSFEPPVAVDALKGIAERLEWRAAAISPIGKRLSYRMIARLLEESVIGMARVATGG